MAKIQKIEPLVLAALKENPKTRGDNFFLYVAVLKAFINTQMSLQAVFENHITLGIPSLESITRIRRKIQQKHPELRDKAADKLREVEKQEFINYARK